MGSLDKPTTRRYTVEQKEQAVRLVRKIRAERVKRLEQENRELRRANATLRPWGV